MSTRICRPARQPGWLAQPRSLPVLCLLLLAACSYRGDIDSPLVRKVSWFSYLDGGDIRETCAAGAADHYRLVYNGRYDEQLRSYEVTTDGTGGAWLVARAMDAANLVDLTFDDLLAPWRWRRSEQYLSPAELGEFEARLAASGMFGPPPVGLRLFSGDFYWIGSACRAGVFRFNAWLYPGDRFARIRFADFLFERDATGIPVNPPREILAGERVGPRGRQKDRTETRFWLQVREDGLGGLPEAF